MEMTLGAVTNNIISNIYNIITPNRCRRISRPAPVSRGNLAQSPCTFLIVTALFSAKLAMWKKTTFQCRGHSRFGISASFPQRNTVSLSSGECYWGDMVGRCHICPLPDPSIGGRHPIQNKKNISDQPQPASSGSVSRGLKSSRPRSCKSIAKEWTQIHCVPPQFKERGYSGTFLSRPNTHLD